MKCSKAFGIREVPEDRMVVAEQEANATLMIDDLQVGAQAEA
jgi:hypothetical protein